MYKGMHRCKIYMTLSVFLESVFLDITRVIQRTSYTPTSYSPYTPTSDSPVSFTPR